MYNNNYNIPKTQNNTKEESKKVNITESTISSSETFDVFNNRDEDPEIHNFFNNFLKEQEEDLKELKRCFELSTRECNSSFVLSSNFK